MIFDIAYSVIFHQSPSYVNHFLKNLDFFNKNNKYIVVLHLSTNLYEKREHINGKNFIINNVCSDKRKYTMCITKATLQNYKFLLDSNVEFNNFMTISSACRFIKQAPHFENRDTQVRNFKKEVELEKYRKWHWNFFKKNSKIINILVSNQMSFCGGQLSGALYERNIFQEIYDFIIDNDILNKVTKQICFEEILLPTLYKYFTGKRYETYCRIFWSRGRKGPSVQQIKNIMKDNNCLIKRADNLESNLMKFIESLMVE